MGFPMLFGVIQFTDAGPPVTAIRRFGLGAAALRGNIGNEVAAGLAGASAGTGLFAAGTAGSPA